MVLEPNSTLWSYYVHAGSSPKLMEIGTNFQAFVTTLEKNQVEYDLGSENIIKDLGKVENGRFIVGNASYSTVVLPPMMETLNKPTFNLLQQFVEQGGQIITFSAPTRIDGAVNDELAGLLTGTTVTSLPELSKDVSPGISLPITSGLLSTVVTCITIVAGLRRIIGFSRQLFYG